MRILACKINGKMAKLSFKKLPEDYPSLFPEDIYERIPANHPVRLIDKVVDSLDISFILSTYNGGGNSAYSPRIMLKILFYAYFSNIYSSRKIAKALEENIYFMWLARHATPNFRTINDFRSKRLKDHIDTLFADLVLMLVKLGYVSLKKQYIDGTKIESASNRYTFVWRKSVEKNKAKLQEKVQVILNVIHRQIIQDDEENDYDLPDEINSEELEKEVTRINEKIKNKPKNKIIIKQLKTIEGEYLPRLKNYEQQLKQLGERNSYSKTDVDATFMRMKDDHMKNGQLKPSYNAQASSEEQFVTYFSIHQTPGDTTCLIPHLDGFKKAYDTQSQEIVADAAYGSEENYEYLEAQQIEAYVKYNYFHQEQKQKHKANIFHPSNLYYNKQEDYYVCPMGQKMRKINEGTRVSTNGYESKVSYYQAQNCNGCPLRGGCHKGHENRIIEINHRLNQLRDNAKTRLLSEKGIYHRSKRPAEIEAVFGQLKSNNKFNRFTLRGLSKVEIEFGLMAIGHNLRKLMVKLTEDNKDLKDIFDKLINSIEKIIVFIRNIFLESIILLKSYSFSKKLAS